MKTIRYAFWAIITLCLVLIGLANRGLVTVRAIPESFSGQLGFSTQMELPLFIVIFAGIAAGLLIGFLWEWVREYRQRAEGRLKAREVETLRRELAALKVKSADKGDDVLALLEA
jgi:putative membrane protein